MSHRLIDDREIVTWLHRGPQAAPAGLLADVLEQVAETPQPAKTRMAALWDGGSVLATILVSAAAITIAVAAFIGLFSPGAGPGSVATPPVHVPTVSPTASPSPEPSASVAFDRPFTYQLDPRWGMTLSAFPNLFQFRTTDPADASYHPTGLNIRPVPEIKRSDFCHPDGDLLARPKPSDFIDALRQLPGYDVSATTTARVDGRDATVVTVVQRPASGCSDRYLFPGTIAFNGAASDGSVRRFTLFQVDGELVSIASFADRGEADAASFFPIADQFIATLHFASATPSASSSP